MNRFTVAGLTTLLLPTLAFGASLYARLWRLDTLVSPSEVVQAIHQVVIEPNNHYALQKENIRKLSWKINVRQHESLLVRSRRLRGGRTQLTALPYGWSRSNQDAKAFLLKVQAELLPAVMARCNPIIDAGRKQLQSAAQEAKSQSSPTPLYDWQKTWSRQYRAELESCPGGASLQRAAHLIASYRRQEAINSFRQSFSQGVVAGYAQTQAQQQAARQAAQTQSCQAYAPGETEDGSVAIAIINVPCSACGTPGVYCSGGQ